MTKIQDSRLVNDPYDLETFVEHDKVMEGLNLPFGSMESVGYIRESLVSLMIR